MTALIERLHRFRRSEMFGQLIRFGVSGLISTLVYSAVYLPLTAYVFPPERAVLAVPPAFLVAVTCGFFLHSAWSFRGHGTRDASGRQHLKFLAVQGFGLVLNALFTWAMTDLLRLPAWTALVPVVTITPLATFFLNRAWVFR